MSRPSRFRFRLARAVWRVSDAAYGIDALLIGDTLDRLGYLVGGIKGG